MSADAEYASSRGWRYIDIEKTELDPEVVSLLGSRDARTYEAIPLAIKDRQIAVAVPDPDSVAVLDALRALFTGYTVRPYYANPDSIRRRVEELYSAGREASRIARDAGRVTEPAPEFNGGDIGMVQPAGGSSVVQIYRLTVEDALRKKASDIHFEPTKDALVVRFRIDGKLQVVAEHDLSYATPLAGFVKVEARMRSDNSFTPESGVLIYKDAFREIDIRVETAPTSWGISIVMRLQSDIWRPLESLGFSGRNYDRFRFLLDQPYGVLICTGPTGSGKTTTLYASLREKIDPETKIITLEAPVEYKVPVGVTQMSVNEETGLTFAKGLRSILRLDPDVVLVGEIRDEETAETAVDAAQTGHLVLSTLHTNNAVGVIPRLARLGIDTHLLAGAVLGVVGQRLVRRLCEHCKVAYTPTREHLDELGFNHMDVPDHDIYRASEDGCKECTAGYKGRVPIHEVLIVDATIEQMIADDKSVFEIEDAARAAGMLLMREDGFEKALAGQAGLADVNATTRRAFEWDEEDEQDPEPEPTVRPLTTVRREPAEPVLTLPAFPDFEDDEGAESSTHVDRYGTH